MLKYKCKGRDKMMDVGKTTWEDGYKKGVWNQRIKITIHSLKALMSNGFTLDEAIDLLKVDRKLEKVVRKRLKE